MKSKFNKEQLYFLISAALSWLINVRSSKKTFKSILIIKWDEIGDMVYALPTFHPLHSEYPEANITLLCKPFVKPLTMHHPAIHQIIDELPKNKKFDMIVELRGNWNTFIYTLKHLPYKRLDRGTVRFKNKLGGGQVHEVETNLTIIKPILTNATKQWPSPIYIDKESQLEADEFVVKNRLVDFAVIHCGGRRALRQWPLANFAVLARTLKDNYKLDIVFVGTEEDNIAINEVIHMSDREAIKCTHNFSLLNLAALVGKAKLFVGNESGPLHIAALMNIPLVGIYGPGVKDIFYPIGKKSRVVHHILDCNPCNQIKCIRPESPCINLVTIEEVESKIIEVLAL